jgi:ParB family chromosome partitioning protein
MTKGAVGAVGRSIADLKARSILEIDPFEIDAGGVRDRLEHDDEDHARLMESLREYGQQVPVLVRPHPDKEDRYQIVYGRRRVLAMRDLGLPVKALVRDLDDRPPVPSSGMTHRTNRPTRACDR